MPDELPSAPVTVTLSLNAESPFPAGMQMAITIANDHDISQVLRGISPTMNVALPFHNGPGDAYRVLVQVGGYHNAGNFVHADPNVHKTLNMLMMPNHATLSFPAWDVLKAGHPKTAHLIGAGVGEADAEARYTALGRDKPLALASMMNLCAAMSDLGIGDQKTPLDFFREVIWDNTLAQDRFFAYADPGIIPLVQAAAAEGEFAEEPNPQTFHDGATLSYKQTEFNYSNVQLTFHGNDTRTIDGVQCIKIEPDMDLYKEFVAHGLGEVIPNRLTNGLTNPLAVLALRWIDAVQSDEPLFDPGYTLS